MLNILPLIPLRGAILFPNNSGQFDIGREKSVEAVRRASDSDGLLIFSTQKDDMNMNPEAADVRGTATLAKILSVASMPNKSMRILVEGIRRIRIIAKYDYENDKYLSAFYEYVEPIDSDPLQAEAYRKNLFDILDDFAAYDRNIQSEAIAALKYESDNNVLIDKIAPHLTIKDTYPILEETDTVKRFMLLTDALVYELEVLKTEKKINIKVKHALDKSQKEHILREQMKVISEELEEAPDKDFQKKIAALNADEEVKNKLLKEVSRLKKISAMSPEFAVVTEYTEFATELPWKNCSDEIRDLNYAKQVLDDEHYGLKKVKERILEYIAVHNLTKSFKSPILCFIGPPGVGKTSIAHSIANATGREFVRMSLGGISDEAEIRGHRKTYVAAMPGRILTGIKQAGTANPVFLLDEIDKLTKSNHGDPSSALLEVLDPEQNNSFRDNYLEIPYDLSNVMFLTTANNEDSIPEPLLDRMEIIQMPSYTFGEKFHIARNHLIAKAAKNNGLSADDVTLDDDALYEIINKYTSEAGVRELERQISKIMRKTAYNFNISGGITAVTKANLADFLGNKTVIKQKKREKDEIGMVTGLAWTSAGGDILPIEINTVKGKGEIITTGNLQDIIKESIKVALTYVHSIASEHGIGESSFKDLDYHIHLPETSVPKEGPSAGAGFASAIYSVLTKKPVKNNIAMTGELSLRGNITAVGGIKEKIMSGFRAGIDVFLIPKDNIPDTDDIPDEIKDKIAIHPISHFDDILSGGLVFADADKALKNALGKMTAEKRKASKIALPEAVDELIIEIPERLNF
ncbi:MAG: endopeptidase La [Clostridiales bacterium]|jgi:ATP-dependent Lon protease|nr:endopeptidase La [Clostridiales bacterium]